MINLIKKWGIPELLQERNVGLVFNPDEISDKINNLTKQYVKDYYKDLHCRDGSVKFCLYDFESNQIAFTMDFFRSNKLSNEKYLKLKILYVNDPELRNKGIATYYLKKLQDYVTEKEIPKIKIYVNTDDKLFENKRNTLSKEELIRFYKSIENENVFIEIQ